MSHAPSVRYITADELAKLLKSKSTKDINDVAVVDVRDDDFVGGNIVAAMNVPSGTFHANVQDLVKRLENGELHPRGQAWLPKVVFHCALSQQRGPKAARTYAEARELCLTEKQREKAQQIYVLRDGFSGFQSKFRDDPELVEKFNKMYHD
ncbi:hypothetical protein EHS25_006541 [Saitozyma podzolica]|uniref:Rhodanese domain-containing protein n=1 Tax=Saitozyma podzolica TaxID=1890683 RepID=A0A427YS54_9TREE|nr:hypothetical protein EHS25_006541 [Saitozyma podzolica]